MSKLVLALVLFMSASLYDPQRVSSLLGPQFQAFCSKLNAALDVDHFIPRLSLLNRR
jgi:hypothetical protein